MWMTPRSAWRGMFSPFSATHALADVLGEIADSLEIVGDPQNADDLAQIDRHRLTRRDGLDCLLLDVALLRVEHGIGERPRVSPCARSHFDNASTASINCRSA